MINEPIRDQSDHKARTESPVDLPRVRVSIAMVTYNHEPFIAQAIQGVLNQRTNFEYELVIGEDCSTDDTRAIVSDYGRRHPERIRLLLPQRNLGMKLNFIVTLQACNGEYVALCDGDDFWTDPYKLQKQVDFLDQHPDYSTCFHDASVLDNLSGRSVSILPNFSEPGPYTLEDLIRWDFMPTCSVMFKNHLFPSFPDWYMRLPMGDWPLHVLNAQQGPIGYLKENMATYRVHQGGVWSGRGLVSKIEAHLQFYHELRQHVERKYHQAIRQNAAYHHYWLAAVLLEAPERFRALCHLAQAVALYPKNPGAPYPLLIRMALRAVLGQRYRHLASLRAMLAGEAQS